MIIVRGPETGRRSEQRRATFTGDVWADPVLSGHELTVATVFFTPGARTFWHSHERGQILTVLAGQGHVCAAGERPQTISAGDVVWVPAGERHWHGAGTDTFMTHTAISLGTTAWEGELPQAEYLRAAQESDSGR